ncbi:UDP-N-acetyl glucosamine 2-epimerase [Nocardioides humi]|uniref:CDP-Glycerol:Poly(Glycerophosphate) glycerophosphotransferase n=1 Tax=Nocardioides humi TaxID=449461 RepID=A0ABN2B2A0_9ACTN|nr:UDP-N-acetyl glucosamine 2-epimerase [Nocardioides humi]
MATAVVSLLWDKHLPALDRFLAERPADVLLTPGAGATPLLRTIADRRGAEVVVLDQLVPLRRRQDIRIGEAVADLDAHLDTGDWLPGGLDPAAADRLRELVRRRVHEDLPAPAAVLQGLVMARATYDLRLMVGSEDLLPASKVAFAWARARRLPSLHLAHSLALVDPYTVHAHLMADVLAVYGERGAEGYLDLGIAPDRIVATGNPAWDGYAELRRDKEAIRRSLREKHGLDPDLPLVVFGTTSSGRLTALDTGNAHEDTLRAFLRACEQLAARGVRLSAVVKDRPSNSEKGREAVEPLTAADSALELRYTSEDTQEWAAAADVLVAVDSNYLVEGMLARTPGVNLAGVALRAGPPAFDAGSGIVEAGPDDLADRIQELLEDPALRAARLARAEESLDRYHAGGVDGRATERVAGLMTRLVDGPGTPAPAPPPSRQSVRERLHHAVDVVVGHRGKQR